MCKDSSANNYSHPNEGSRYVACAHELVRIAERPTLISAEDNYTKRLLIAQLAKIWLIGESIGLSATMTVAMSSFIYCTCKGRDGVYLATTGQGLAD
jgi:hypothetical protein